MESPRPMSHGARRGQVEVTGLVACPGRGLCAHAGAGEELPDGVPPRPIPCRACRGGGGGCPPAGYTPRSWLVRARRGAREDTRLARRPGRGRLAHSGPGGRGSVETSRLTPHSASQGGADVPVVAGARTPGRWEDTRLARRPGRGRLAHSGPGGRRSVETSRLSPHSASQGGADVPVVADARTPGRGEDT